jgi:predicted nucleic acid-binding protein
MASGLSTDDAIAEVRNLMNTYKLLPETEEVFQFWQELVREFKVEGKAAHDARLVAFMQQHQIVKLYTLNQSDFTRYSSVLQLV